jgi:hypothetical protein
MWLKAEASAKVNCLMLFKEIIPVYSENKTKHLVKYSRGLKTCRHASHILLRFRSHRP